MKTRDALHCPVDGASLTWINLKGTPVNVCRECAGTFLDSSALDDVIRESIHSEEIISELDSAPDRKPEDGSQKHRTCPRCRNEMTTSQFLAASRIFLDRCHHCNGVWADHGEVKAVTDFVTDQHKTSNETRMKHEASMRAMGVEIAKAVSDRHKLQDLADLSRNLSGPVTPLTLLLPKIILPLRSDQKGTSFPVATISLIIVNALILLLQWILVDDLNSFFRTFGLVPTTLLDGARGLTIVSSMFLHAGFFHLFGNMLYLWIFGCAIEQTLNSQRFLIWYVISGVAAALLHIGMNIGVPVPMVGASGAIAGVLGMYIVLYPQSNIETLIIDRVMEVPAWLYLGIWIGYQVLMGAILAAAGVCCGVAWAAHIGGFFTGAALAIIAKRVDAQAVQS